MYVVGITATCARLALFRSLKRAEAYIATLPLHEDGRYYIDGPCKEVIL